MMQRRSILGFPVAILAAVPITFMSACDETPTEPARIVADGPAFAAGAITPSYSGQTITLNSGVDDDSDGRDDVIVFTSTGSGDPPQPAYVLANKHPAWAEPISGTQWIGPLNSSIDGEPGTWTFTTEFDLPDQFGLPILNIQTHTDNCARVELNTVFVGEYSDPCVDADHFQGDPEPWSLEDAAGFNAGKNTLTIELTNPAWDGANPAGLDFQAVVTYVVPPVITDLAAPSDPVALTEPVQISAMFTDADPGDTHTCEVDWGDLGPAETVPCDVSGGLSATHRYDEPGLFTVTVTVTDAPGGLSATRQPSGSIVVYDPTAGFVTGGGWITSPEGAMPSTTTPVTVSGVSGDPSTDPGLEYGQYYLRYVGDPAPTGYSHSYQWASPWVVTPSPEDGPVVMVGTIDVDEQVVGQVAMIGLLDRDDLAAGNSSFQRGAYIYVYRSSATSWRIGLSDGNAGGGELVQAFATIADTDLPADGVLDVVFTIDGTGDGTACAAGSYTDPAGCMTLELTGGNVNVSLTDSYGDIVGDATASPEFANGAVPGWDDYLGSNVAYTLTVPSQVSASPEGRASFGFVAKYKKGADTPDGNTQFTFEAGDLEFHSTSYDWLVVNQGDERAQFKGVGTVNDVGDYKFQLWAGDHDDGDTFRIKIWEEDGAGIETVVYDNGEEQHIEGGNIIVHDGKRK